MRKMGSWMNGLYTALSDSSNWIISNDEIVVISDKYPKAKFHFLVLPREKISDIFQLRRNHLNLLKEMHLMALNVIEVKGQKPEDFQIGYHAIPSMLQVHLHVISTDFNSPCLKNKKHWNSFTTKYFVPHEELVRKIEVDGKFPRIDAATAADLLKAPLKCHRCDATPKSIPDLKSHISKHL